MSVELCEKCRRPRLPNASRWYKDNHLTCWCVVATSLPRTDASPSVKVKTHTESIEDLLEGQLEVCGIPYEREFRFCPSRKWRADFFLVGTPFLVEAEGILWVEGGFHQRPRRYESDCLKYTQAAIMGYRVLRFTGGMIRDGRAIAKILEALEQEKPSE